MLIASQTNQTHDLLIPGPYRFEGGYADRETKAAWIARVFAPILRETVLDVGCDNARLGAEIAIIRERLREMGFEARPGREGYLGVDLAPEADLVLDLNLADLPFEDRSFTTVVCTDVLEHLDRPHEVLDECCRVSSERVVVSLPNCVRNLLIALLEGGAGRLKHYGLPVDPPADRHAWFFGFEDAARFIAERARRAGFIIEQLSTEDERGPYWLGPGGQDLLAPPNTRYGTLWAVLRRDDPASADPNRADPNASTGAPG